MYLVRECVLRECIILPKVPKIVPKTTRHATTAGITTEEVAAVTAVAKAPIALKESKLINKFLASKQSRDDKKGERKGEK